MFITTYIVMINITGFVTAGIDKYRAIHKKWRIAEKRFFILTVFGGGPGVYTGCLVFNHKIRDLKFMTGIPAICIIEAAIILLLT